jgi:uncharacterized protein YjdB
MFGRDCFKVLGLVCLVLPFTGCTNTQVASIQLSPSSQTMAVGQTVQFSATGIIPHGSHPAASQDVTDQVTWSSGTPAVATVSSTGLATAVGAGTAVITATYPGTAGATATLTVTAVSGGGTTGGLLVALSIIPGTQSVPAPGDTTQFIAIGTTTSGATENLTTSVTWASSSAQVATISAGGLATGVSQGTTTITAIATNANNTVVTGIAAFTVTGGTSQGYTALSIIPSSQSVSASGQITQLIALGTQGSTGLEEDVTDSNSIQWSSSVPTIATVGLNTGTVTGVSPGSTTITAIYTNPANNGAASVVSATATVTVTQTPAPEPLISLTIVPSTITVDQLQDTGNFLAIGTFSDVPYTRDLTNSVQWLSSAPEVFPVSTNASPANPGAPAGVVTAYGNGGAIIIAEATSTDGTIQTATASFNCPLALPNPAGDPPTPGTCYPGSQTSGLLVTLTVYNEGLNTTNWEVTAPSATGTPDVIHCGPGWTSGGGAGGSVCTATYPVNTVLTLTAPAGAGQFGGWSYNCTPILAVNAAGPNSCSITLGSSPTSNNGVTSSAGSSNVTVGAIFN